MPVSVAGSQVPAPVALVIGQLELGGGAERQLAELAVGLGAQGFRPVVFSLRAGPLDRSGDPQNYWADVLRARGIRVRELRRRGDLDLLRLIPLARMLREEAPVIVHSFMFAANAYARVAVLLSGVRPVLITGERTGRLPAGRLERLVGRCLEPLTDGIITNSQMIRRLLVERGARVPIWVIPNGIDAGRYAPERRPAARSLLGIGPDVPVIGTVARMSAEKNYPFFLEVVRRTAARLPGLRAIAIGDGPLRPAVEEAVRRDGLEGTVTLAGRVPDVAAVLPALDVFVLVSAYEGLSNAIMEAQSCGLPCVATDVGGNREIVVEGRTGHLLSSGDPEEYAGRIAALLRDRSLLARMSRESRLRIENTFGIDRMIAATADVYRELLARRRERQEGRRA